MTASANAPVTGTLAIGAPFVLTLEELRTPTASVRLQAVTHVALIDRPARTPTRVLVKLGATLGGLVLAGVALLLDADRSLAAVLVLLPLLGAVLLSDWAERRFPTPGRYGIAIASRTGVVRVEGLVSEEAAQLLHEQVALAVRSAQRLNG